MERSDKVKVTVIIPAYNADRYIEQCAESVLNQTLDDMEIIFIDDGSTDETGKILDRLVAGREDARVIHQENRGLYASRESGLSLASGEYVGWIDADDYAEPDMFEVMYNTAIENDSELVICNYSWVPRKLGTKAKWFREYKGKVDTTFVEQNSQPWNKIVKRSLMERLGISSLFVRCFDEIYIRILLEAKNPITLTRELYNYRVAVGSMSASYKDVEHYRNFVEATKELRSVMDPVTSDNYWRDYFDYRVIYYLLMTMVVAAYSGDKDAYVANRKELMAFSPKYNHNQHYHRILKENFGNAKSLVIGDFVPVNYGVARLVCTAGIKWSLKKK